jgi:hypothetical protein
MFCARFAEGLAGATSSGEKTDGKTDEIAKAWLYGFVTHQAVDRVLHPYIVYRSYVDGNTGLEGVTPARLHAFLERILDTALYLKVERLPLSSFDVSNFRRIDDECLSPLVRRIAIALEQTFPGEADGNNDLELRVANAFADSLYYYDITNPASISMDAPPDEMRRALFLQFSIDGTALLHPESVAHDVDWLNEQCSFWQDPVTGAERHESVIELFDIAVSLASSVIHVLDSVFNRALDADSLERTIGNGPLTVTGSDGKVGTAHFTQTFDLAGQLRKEAKKRYIWLTS